MGGIIWEEKIAAVTRRLSFGSFNSIEMAAAQLGAQSSQRGEGGRERGSWRWEGEGSPPWSLCAEKLWEWKVAEAAGEGRRRCWALKGRVPSCHSLYSTSWPPDHASSASCGKRRQVAAGPLCSYLGLLVSPPTSPPHFLLPLPSPQRARGSCSPLPPPHPPRLRLHGNGHADKEASVSVIYL